MNYRPVSAIGKAEHIRRGDKIVASYDATFDEYLLCAIGRRGQGEANPLPCWTALYRESPKITKTLLLRNGAQIAISQLSLLS